MYVHENKENQLKHLKMVWNDIKIKLTCVLQSQPGPDITTSTLPDRPEDGTVLERDNALIMSWNNYQAIQIFH